MQNPNGDVHFFRFQPEIPCLGQFGPKNQNCQLKVKLDTYTNTNIQNLMMLFTFFVFDWKHRSWANLVQIVNIYSFFLFPIRNAFFWKNLVQKVKIFSLTLNLLLSLIWICRIQKRCSLFCFWLGIHFLSKFGPEN